MRCATLTTSLTLRIFYDAEEFTCSDIEGASRGIVFPAQPDDLPGLEDGWHRLDVFDFLRERENAGRTQFHAAMNRTIQATVKSFRFATIPVAL